MNAKAHSFLALGDSYTIGEDVNKAESWPFQLANKLTEMGFTISPVKVIARTGWRTDNLAAAIEEEEISSKYDLVSLQIGVNNQFQGKDIETYKSDLRGLLNTAITLCRKGKDGVFVLSIPDYGATPFGKIEREAIGKEIEQWNIACKSICEELGVSFFDITPISKKGTTDPALVAKDGLHPSGNMYSLWVDEILHDIINLISKT